MPEIDDVLQLPQRKLVIANNDVYLDKNFPTEIFILMVEESRGSAGGRAAGSGHRRINKVIGFSCKDGNCIKSFETEDQGKIDQFDIPYSAVAMDIRLSTGKEYVVQGVVDSELTKSYTKIAISQK